MADADFDFSQKSLKTQNDTNGLTWGDGVI